MAISTQQQVRSPAACTCFLAVISCICILLSNAKDITIEASKSKNLWPRFRRFLRLGRRLRTRVLGACKQRRLVYSVKSLAAMSGLISCVLVTLPVIIVDFRLRTQLYIVAFTLKFEVEWCDELHILQSLASILPGCSVQDGSGLLRPSA